MSMSRKIQLRIDNCHVIYINNKPYHMEYLIKGEFTQLDPVFEHLQYLRTTYPHWLAGYFITPNDEDPYEKVYLVEIRLEGSRFYEVPTDILEREYPDECEHDPSVSREVLR